MSTTSTAPTSPITPATVRRLLYALCAGALLVAAFSLLLTGLDAPTMAASVFASVAAALAFAAGAFEIAELRAARTAAALAVAAHADTEPERDAAHRAVESSEESMRRHVMAVDAAITIIAAATVAAHDATSGDDQQPESAATAGDGEDDEPSEPAPRDVAITVLDALLDEPELLDELFGAACARELADVYARTAAAAGEPKVEVDA